MEEMESIVVIEPIIFENVKFITNPSTMAEQETDYVIIFNGKHRIPINKAVMTDRCTFFTSMSMHGFKESKAKEISIQYNTDVTTYKALVDYIHRGKIELTTANLETVIAAAIYFQLNVLLEFCCDVMMKNTDISTVGQVYEFAKELALTDLRKAVVDFDVEHFNKIANSEVFYGWLVECILELLSSDEIEVSHERKVVQFVFDWLNVDPNERGRHAAELFRNLRFSFLNEEIMTKVVTGNSNEKLGQVFHGVANEFSNKITPPRRYQRHKGVYILGYNPRDTPKLFGKWGHAFMRYCPNDKNITPLKIPGFMQTSGFNSDTDDFVVDDNGMYMARVSLDQFDTRTWNIHLEKYEAEKDEWKLEWTTSPDIGSNESDFKSAVYAYHDEKIFVFLVRNESGRIRSFCVMYCIKTKTWQRLRAFEGIRISSATTCGDSIYMTLVHTPHLLQYKPSTDVLTEIPCEYILQSSKYKAIAYKSSILFLPTCGYKTTEMVLFNTGTNDFRSYDFMETYKANNIYDTFCFCSLFQGSVFVCTPRPKKFFELDLAFIDRKTEPNLIPVPAFSGWTTDVYLNSSIQ